MKTDAEIERAAVVAYQAAPMSEEGRAAAGVLVEMHGGLIFSIVKRFANHLVTVADLRQEGALALLRAAKRHDGRGPLAQYAGTAIAFAALSYRWSRGSDLSAAETTVQAADLLRRADESGKDPSEFVPAGHISLKKIARASADLRTLGRRAARLDAPNHEGDGTYADRIAAPDRDVEAMIRRRREVEAMMSEFDRLNPRQRMVLERLYLIDTPETGEQIGLRLGVSRQRIDQIKAEAIGLIRARIHRATLRKETTL